MPLIASKTDGQLDTRNVVAGEYISLLRKKLSEECFEVLEALTTGNRETVLEELADIVEVVDALARHYEIGLDEVLDRKILKANERGSLAEGVVLRGLEAKPRRLLTNDTDPTFLEELRAELSKADQVDIAVSFIMGSGLDLLEAAIAVAAFRGCKFRLLTTDYMGVSEPEALRRILSLIPDSRVFDAKSRSFHPKAYLFTRPDGSGRSFVGSANISRSALIDGVEWTWSVLDFDVGYPMDQIREKFEDLYFSSSTVPLTQSWIDDYELNRFSVRGDSLVSTLAVMEPSIEPRPVQKLALNELKLLRLDGESRGLVVAATGLGKTYLAALDSVGYRRVLFIAHREELLIQARKAFERIHSGKRFGFVVAGKSDIKSDVVFATIQSLSRERVLDRIGSEDFDYVVIDEFHHAAAKTYRKVLDKLSPQFLLGITATPFRSDNRDLLALCDGNLAFQVGLYEAISLGWLVPFKYFGVSDVVRYQDEWLSNNQRYDESILTQAFNSIERASLALKHYRSHRGRAALGFCVSIKHADFMSQYFCSKGVRAASVHSGDSSADRAGSLRKLEEEGLDIIFTVDLFNEGVDIPHLDLVLFLRPTESMTVFLQQLGRGLRIAERKSFLTVIDLIGNYRNVDQKISFLFGDDGSQTLDRDLALKSVNDFMVSGLFTSSLPLGVEVTLDHISSELLRRALTERGSLRDRCTSELRMLREEFDGKLTFSGFIRSSVRPWRSLRTVFGASSWLGVMEATGLISRDQMVLKSKFDVVFHEVENASMTKSFKMVVLRSMFRDGQFLEAVNLAHLVFGFRDFFKVERWRTDLIGTAIQQIDTINDSVLGKYLIDNPINAWIGGNRREVVPFFEYSKESQVFRYIGPKIDFAEDSSRLFSEELWDRVTAKLELYFRRPGPGRYVFPIIPSNEKKTAWCVMFGRHRDSLPTGWALVKLNGRVFKGNFVKVALNVISECLDGTRNGKNVLSDELLKLFEGSIPSHARVRFIKMVAEPVWEIVRA